jgi:hypothetical protein
MTPYAVIARPIDLREVPKQYQQLRQIPVETAMPRVLKIVTVDRQAIFLYHLGSNRVYNVITLEEIKDE